MDLHYSRSIRSCGQWIPKWWVSGDSSGLTGQPTSALHLTLPCPGSMVLDVNISYLLSRSRKWLTAEISRFILCRLQLCHQRASFWLLWSVKGLLLHNPTLSADSTILIDDFLHSPPRETATIKTTSHTTFPSHTNALICLRSSSPQDC